MKMLWVSNLYYLRYLLFIWNIDILCVFLCVTDLLCIEEEKKCYGSKCHSRTSATIERGQPSGSSTFWHCFHLLRIQCTQNTTQFTWSMYTIWYCRYVFLKHIFLGGLRKKNFFFRYLLRFLLLETTKKTWLVDVTIYLYGYMLVETYPNF